MKQVVRKRVRDANPDIVKEDNIYTLLLDMNNIMKIKPMIILKICFLVITKPKEES